LSGVCGILGVFHYGNASVSVSEDLLARMRDTMRHRGPDDAGLWLNPSRTLGLANRRLSIIDLSADARQPMCNEDGTVWVTLNGEIYNYRELREDLGGRGHRFRSHADTEVILHLYEEKGADGVQQLDGMFAYGLWDEVRQTLVLARDRLGVKPLYYTQQQGCLLFASEIKVLLEHPLVGRDVDRDALCHYLTFKTTPAPWTMFAGIRKLPAGCLLTCDRKGDVQIAPYWDAIPQVFRSEATESARAAAIVRELLTSAVVKRMMSDVPTGVFLSGGLDSSAIVALLAPRMGQPVNTFSVGISDLEGCNELDFARQVADRFGTNHHEILIGRKELEESFHLLVDHLDEPVADPVCVPLYYLSRVARASGVTVVQVGEGSDEQFLGYESRLDFLRNFEKRWRPLLSLPRPVLAGLSATAGLIQRTTGRGKKLRQVFQRAARGHELFWGSVAFSEDAKAELVAGSKVFAGCSSQVLLDQMLQPLRSAWPGADMAACVSYLDLKVRLAELLLMRVDKVTMACGVEAREPFLDYRLVEYLMTLPRTLKIKEWQPKHLLKQALTGIVPDEILRRPKKVFAAPVNAWLRDGLAPFARQVLFDSRLRARGYFLYDVIERMLEEHVNARQDHGVRLWTLMNLSAWYDHWFK
jgi:asparagine synthase (glutamine-hydrolysing)